MEYPFIRYDAARDRLDFKKYPAGYHYSLWEPERPWDTGREADRDMEYLRELYPSQTKSLQTLVEEECEKQDYEGSPLYDEYPDKLAVWMTCRRIRDRAEKEGIGEAFSKEETDKRPFFGETLLDQMILILFSQEMCRRRRRKRERSRWL